MLNIEDNGIAFIPLLFIAKYILFIQKDYIETLRIKSFVRNM